MTLKVVDRFTTRDGRWEVDPRPYGLTQEALAKYGGEDIPGKGGAAHIFVRLPKGAAIKVYTSDGKNAHRGSWVEGSQWGNYNLWASSAFWGDNNGPWCVDVNGVQVAKGLGLPEGLHVSTFLIVEDVEEGSQPIPPTPDDDHVQLLINGVVVFDNWSAQ